MRVTKTALDGVLLVGPPTNFEDFRGSYGEIYNSELYKQAGITVDFIQDDISTSSRHVLRGLHGDGSAWKLVSCLYGRHYLVVVNNDPASPQYRKSLGLTLSDTNRLQVLIPLCFANGHVVLSETAIFHYKQNTTYDRSSQFTLLWNGPELGLRWPIKTPIVSRRDEGLEN